MQIYDSPQAYCGPTSVRKFESNCKERLWSWSPYGYYLKRKSGFIVCLLFRLKCHFRRRVDDYSTSSLNPSIARECTYFMFRCRWMCYLRWCLLCSTKQNPPTSFLTYVDKSTLVKSGCVSSDCKDVPHVNEQKRVTRLNKIKAGAHGSAEGCVTFLETVKQLQVVGAIKSF